MNIGIVCENRPQEKRAILRPDELKEISKKHEVFVEKGLGEGIGIKDSEYKKAGATIVDTKTAYGCSLVVRLKEPTESELAQMKPGSAIMSMMHISSNTKLRELLKKNKVVGIAMDEIKNIFGKRLIEALHISGYMCMETGFRLWGKDPATCVVKVMGYGNVASGAIQCAARKCATVIVLNKRDFLNMRQHIPGTDIFVNAINWPMEKRGKEFFITRDMLKLFKKGAVIADCVSNPEGQSPIESMHPTYLDKISYEVDGVIHTSCWAWPGLDPVAVSKRYSMQVAPILAQIADQGLQKAPEHIRRAVHTLF